MKIYIDKREKKPLVEELAAQGFEIEFAMIDARKCSNCKRWYVTMLDSCPHCLTDKFGDEDVQPVGDYMGENFDWAKERKADDFYGSVIDGRLFDQMAIGADCFGNRYQVLVEGYLLSIVDEHRDQEGLIRSMRTYANDVLGVGFAYVEDREEMAKEMRYTAKACEKGYKARYTIKKKDKIPQLEGVATIPGVGVKSARLMLAAVGTVENIIKMNPTQISGMVKGFGPVRAQAVYDYYRADVMDKVLEEMEE